MPEELKIIVVDEGAARSASTPETPPAAAQGAPAGSSPTTFSPPFTSSTFAQPSIPEAPPKPGPPEFTPREREEAKFKRLRDQTSKFTSALAGAAAGRFGALADQAGGFGQRLLSGFTTRQTGVGGATGLFTAPGIAAIGVFAAALTGAVAVIAAFVAETSRQAKLLARFSPEIARVQQENRFALLDAQQRRAERIGPLVAETEQSRGQLSEAFFDLGTSVRELILTLTDSFTPVLDLARGGVEGFTAVTDFVNTIAGNGVVSGIGILDAFNFLKQIRDGLERIGLLGDRNRPHDRFVEQFLEMAGTPPLGSEEAGRQRGGRRTNRAFVSGHRFGFVGPESSVVGP